MNGQLWDQNKIDPKEDWTGDFQTPAEVCEYMATMIPRGARTILEPTPGKGNLVRVLEKQGYEVTAPADFFQMASHRRFDCVVGNPPFSAKYAYGVPEHLDRAGMRLGYYILTHCMQMSDEVIALMPWFTISDSDVRMRNLKRWGLVSITALPRKTFGYTRVQTTILHLRKGHTQETIFKVFDLLAEGKKKAQTTLKF